MSARATGDSADSRPAARSASVGPTIVQLNALARLLVDDLGGGAEGDDARGRVGLDDDGVAQALCRRWILVSRCAWSSLAMWYSAFSLRSPISRAKGMRLAMSLAALGLELAAARRAAPRGPAR